ncbi:IgGFc-binding protein-like isoform X2 [Pseudophryne corroboree]|uniref:IgGFc-binding protein-like isoform X2 n=1 Tax=Pseudophryne corroboree TaxID=495146 RepID=UPI0030813FC8
MLYDNPNIRGGKSARGTASMGNLWLPIVLLLGLKIDAGQTQTKYITAFMENYAVSTDTTFQLYLLTYNKTASVTVTVSNPHFSKTVFIERESSALVNFDYTYMITESQKTSKAVLVTSDVDISVFAFYTHIISADAMACLSLEDLGTEYYISTTGPRTSNQFAVANGLEEVVSVTVTISGSITFKGLSYSSGDSFSFQLEYQQVVQFKSADDLTVTRVSSTAPVAVFSGHTCFSGINNACDSLAEQLHPVKNWGSSFVVFPLLNHTKDVIKVISASPDTTVDINGLNGDTHHSLQNGSYIEITVDKGMTIKSTKSIMVTYIFQDFIPGVVTVYDPFITNVPPSLVTRMYYRFVTQARYYNFLLIVSQASASDGFYLDHRQLSSYSVSLKTFSGFHAWEVSLGKTDGQHEIYHESMPFTIYVYGIENYVSYGYSMGQEAIYAGVPATLPCRLTRSQITGYNASVSIRFYDFQEVYLTCNVIICHNETSPNHCTQGCNMRRHRRDTHSSDRQLNSARLSQGPILFKSGQFQAARTVPSSLFVAVVGVVGFLSVLGLVIQKHHYKRHKYTLLGNGSHQQ